MRCRVEALPGPDILASKTLRAFGSGVLSAAPGVEGPWLAPLFTAGALFYLATLLWWQGRASPKRSIVRPMVVFYILITGIVEVTRVIWDVSRAALISAALHNLAEWGLILLTLFPDPPGRRSPVRRGWWFAQLWILAIINWICFAPGSTPKWAGVGEEATGLWPDWLLIFAWARLAYASRTRTPTFVWWGLAGAILHMLEILPLLFLLVGFINPPPWLPGSIIISLTTPLTYFSYSRMVSEWEALAGQNDLVTPVPEEPTNDDSDDATQDKPPAGQAPTPAARRSAPAGRSYAASSADAWKLLLLAVVVGTAVFGGLLLIPVCPPGQAPPAGAPANATAPANSTAPAGSAGQPAMSGLGAPTNATMCESSTKLVGTTTVYAKPEAFQGMVAAAGRMPGPIRQEPGNRYYEVAAGSGQIRFWESWSSITTLYRHIFNSVSVRDIYRSEGFQAGFLRNASVDGPFKALIPCTEAGAEAVPVVLPFEVLLDAPMELLAPVLMDWSNVSWVYQADHVEMITPYLRRVDMGGETITETLQVDPLPAVEQPPGGHRLVYHIVTGTFLDTEAEAYKGEYTILPSKQHPGKTILAYTATVTAKTPNLTEFLENFDSQALQYKRLPYVQEFARKLAAEAEVAQYAKLHAAA